MKIEFSKRAQKSYKKLPLLVKNKVVKQMQFLRTNPNHPSLQRKKMKGENYFEARVDYHYRFTFLIKEDTIYLLTLGPHDEGLGKK